MGDANAMAFFSDLVRAVAQAEGMDEMTVTGIGQYLRDEGMITKGGRGRSAARMSSQDAANLLIAVNGTALAKDAPKAVNAFRALETQPMSLEFTSNPFAELSTGTRSFGTALERLLDWGSPDPTGKCKLELILSDQSNKSVKGADKKIAVRRKIGILNSGLEIVFRRPLFSATIQMVDPHLAQSKDKIAFFGGQQISFYQNFDVNTAIRVDRRDLTIITAATLISVARAIYS